MQTHPTVVQVVQEQAQRHPDREAFTFLADGEQISDLLTYGELDRRARSIAAELQDIASPGDRAVILTSADLQYVAAFFGCLYAGVIAVPFYVPRQDQSPDPLETILRASGAHTILASSATRETIESLSAAVPALRQTKRVVVDKVERGLERVWRQPSVKLDSLASLMFTSGSTATPKGVMVAHETLASLADAMEVMWKIQPDDRMVQWTPLHFAMAMNGVATAPAVGYPVTLVPPAVFLEQPVRWLQVMSRTGATISGGPTFCFDFCARTVTVEERATLDLSRWRTAWIGGEHVRIDVLDRFAAAFRECGFRREVFVPAFGMSEGVSASASSRTGVALRRFQAAGLEEGRADPAREGERARTLVGYDPTAGTQTLLIVNPETCLPCGRGEVGELWAAGPGVARGYWNQPEETERTFHAHLASGEGPFFRTGDLAFIDDDLLFITGRLKEMIIIRGRNLYPQDIELAVEGSHPHVLPAAGAAFSVDVDDEERLVIVQEVDGKSERLDEVAGAIRRAVAERFEVQVYAVILVGPGSVPRTGTGKIQRRPCRQTFLEQRLPALHSSVVGEMPAEGRARYVAPRTPTESAIASLWEAVLGIERVGIHDSFYDLGGDSILSVRLTARAGQQGIPFSLAQLVEHPTIAQLAPLVGTGARIEANQGIVSGSAPPIPRQVQELEQPMHSNHQITPLVVSLPAAADPEVVEAAFREVIEHHDALRTRFRRVGDRWQQIVAAQEDRPNFTFVDVSSTSKMEQRLALVEAFQGDHNRLDAANGPLAYATLVRRGSNRSSLFALLVHHLVTDAFSTSILTEDLSTAYKQLERGEEVALPPKTTSAKRWAERLAEYADSPELRPELQHWRRAIAPNVPLLPADFAYDENTLGGDRGAVVFLPADETNVLLHRAPQVFGARPNEMILAALAWAFEAWTGSPRLLLSVANHGRGPLFPELDVSRTISFFTATFPVLLDTQRGGTMGERLARISEQLRAVPNGGIGYGALRYLSRDPEVVRSLQELPIPQVHFNYQGVGDASQTWATSSRELSRDEKTSQLLWGSLLKDDHPAHSDIMIWAYFVDGELALPIRAHSRVYSAETIDRLAADTSTALHAIVAECQTPALARAGT